MRKQDRIFHLAIPCNDLQTTKDFYCQFDECSVAREYDDRVTFNFFGDQLVCHICPNHNSDQLSLYPRHFGITFLKEEGWQLVLDQVVRFKIKIFEAPFSRFEGKPEAHKSFVIVDPSNNLIEFKYYFEPRMAY